MAKRIKIGIDVGGTFTHAVAIDISNYAILGKVCMPTTHTASEGVARGVVESLHLLIEKSHLNPDEIILIAHSTTQATNALLEGDVAPVGVIALGSSRFSKIIQRQSNLGNIELAPGKFLRTFYTYLEINESQKEPRIREAISNLVGQGAEVIVASQAFGIENPEREEQVVHIATEMGYLATAASQLSKLYGLRIRTRTAVINASMLPKMLETANLTEKAVRESGINAPLMIMRSDGGIMDINEMRKRPILSMLSGPAAGVAAALMYVKVSDGIFLEVGGTSTDISVIKHGKPQVKYAQVGGNRLFLKTLDVRTVGIAGGSLPRLTGKRISDVGPRSAHIANLSYVAFSPANDYSAEQFRTFQPMPGDPPDYLAIQLDGEERPRLAVTTTEAAYYLKSIPAELGVEVNQSAIKTCFAALGEFLQQSPEKIAHDILAIATHKIEPTIDQLRREYKLEREFIHLVGGGGGAPALVPFAAHQLGFEHYLAENCQITSAIGAALGIIRDTIEKNIINPSPADLLAIRQEAVASVQAMGAIPESIEVSIEVDNRNKRVQAIATGSSELRTRDLSIKKLSTEDILTRAAQILKTDRSQVKIEGKTAFLFAITSVQTRKHFFGLFHESLQPVRVIDHEGILRLQINDGTVVATIAREVKSQTATIIEKLTTYGDAGALLPDLFLLCAAKIIDLSGLVEPSQVLALAEIELEKVPPTEPIVIVAAKKK